MMIPPESPRALMVDGSLAAWGALLFFRIIPAISGMAALALIVLRIVIGIQEYRINRRKLND